MTINCPHCGRPTQLLIPVDGVSEGLETEHSAPEVLAGFTGTMTKTPVSLFYQLGLVLAAGLMVVLPLVYLAMIGAVAYGVYYYATHFVFLVHSVAGGVYFFFIRLLAYGAPLFAGVVMTLFMIKPLFARRPRRAEALALNPEVEPTLFAFIGRVCELVGAPMPSRIDLDCNLNASASFRYGLSGALGKSDLSLTLGLPLVAALDAREMAGVIAHEFGHFTQGFAMRLSYVVRVINGWFARVVCDRDAWDESLESAAEEAEDWRILALIGTARFGVWFSRLLLKMLMITGHAGCCFLLRQMEFDADTDEIKVAGSECFESTMLRFEVLNKATELAYKEIRVGWNNARILPDDFPRYIMHHESKIPAVKKEAIAGSAGLARSGLFHTHPSTADRIRRARQAGAEGVFHLGFPASALFVNFSAVARQVTRLHYQDDLGIPVGAAAFVQLTDQPRLAIDRAAIPLNPAKAPAMRVRLPEKR